MSEVPRTFFQFMLTSCADIGFVTYAHAQIQWAIRDRFLCAVQLVGRELDLGDGHDLLLGQYTVVYALSA